jgi:hypothetical protein
MAHCRKDWKPEDGPGAAEDEQNWRICKERDYTFKGESFPPPNTILDDFLMFRVAISGLTKAERMKRWLINFSAKGYPNRGHEGTGAAAKRRNPSNFNKYHYMVICGTYQLHEAEEETQGLRRIRPGQPTVKINECFGDECVKQSEENDKYS